MIKWIILCGFLMVVIKLSAQDKIITTASQLKTLRQIKNLPRYVEATKLLQVSSYDTTGGNNDGFSGDYSFIRKNPDSSLVIFEEKGNGAINRIWTPTPTEDTLDFYFGKTGKPSFSIKFSDLFSGNVYPFVQPLSGNEIGGFYTYFPIPYTNGCKIVLRGKKLEFYQIQHSSFPRDQEVQNFSMNLSPEAKNELDQIKKSWLNMGDLDTFQKKEVDTSIAPGEDLELAQFNSGGRITGLQIYNAHLFEGLEKQMDLKITWDNEQTPAVYMPLADFFGYAFGKISMQSLLVGSKEDMNYCFFPMPFDQAAKIELVYRSAPNATVQKPLPIKAKIFFSNEPRNPKTEGKFYGFWNSNINAPLGQPHVFLEGEGKGHYVGTILQAQGLNPGMTLFFEGDDVTTIDGEMRMHGTGSEDYFNGGWYALLNRWDRKISLPLHGALDYSLPYARTGGYRLFLLDKMPFNKSINHTMEHGPEKNNMPVNYTSVAFYYANNMVSTKQEEPTNALTEIYIPKIFMLYPQLMKYTVAGNMDIDGNVMASTNNGQVRIDLSEIPEGRYKLFADIEKWPEGTEISLWQRQKIVADSISFFAENHENVDDAFLGDINIDGFRQTLTLKLKTDKNRSKINIKRLILKQNKD